MNGLGSADKQDRGDLLGRKKLEGPTRGDQEEI